MVATSNALAKSYDLVNPLYSLGDDIQTGRTLRVLGLHGDWLIVAYGFAEPLDCFTNIPPSPFRRLVPNSMSTINRMIRSFPVLKPPNPIFNNP